MNEEAAIFDLGKRLSELRNSGEDLSDERVLVGNSWVLPDELADEYEKHFPPGPRRYKQATTRKFQYEMVMDGDCRGELVGLKIAFQGRSIHILEKAAIISCSDRGPLKIIKSSRCNRYDVIFGANDTFVIDKIDETMSIARGTFLVDSKTCCNETPIAGMNRQYIVGASDIPLCTTYFPFVPFDRFWPTWYGYIEFRKRQINELRNTEQAVSPNGP